MTVQAPVSAVFVTLIYTYGNNELYRKKEDLCKLLNKRINNNKIIYNS